MEGLANLDGTGVRDYIHVMDLAEGHFLALELLIKEKPQILSMNLGTGKGTSVLELINVFEKINGVKILILLLIEEKVIMHLLSQIIIWLNLFSTGNQE